MKRRTVKVKVYLVDLTASDGSRRALDPDLIPSKDSVTNHLNDIFAKQINAWFDVEIGKDKDPLTQQEINFLADQRTDGDNSFTIAYTSISLDQQEVLSKTGPGVDCDIRVFMLAATSVFAPDGAGYGATSRDHATCWVAGQKTSVKYDSPENVLSSIGHEIGHVLADYGHPDDPSAP
ncbi:MAG: hypothetical protein KDN05_17765, partial [Verrucomicrobiae bacterium]|nr:hypothetical protein [Verrucomicrobiae bacterium]